MMVVPGHIVVMPVTAFKPIRFRRSYLGSTMISRKYKCVFVHVPKAAGQSIENFFLSLHGLTWETRSPLLLRSNRDPAIGPQSLAHLTAQEYIDCGHLSRDEFESYFKFSFVRNPWDRLVSEFRYRRYDEKYTFAKFVQKRLPKKDSFSDAYRHILPQYDFLHDEAGTQLVDFIGRFENLQNDFDYVCSQLGVADTMLRHVNSEKQRPGIRTRLKSLFSKRSVETVKRPYISYYDDRAMELVGEIYAADISAFGYKFGE